MCYKYARTSGNVALIRLHCFHSAMFKLFRCLGDVDYLILILQYLNFSALRSVREARGDLKALVEGVTLDCRDGPEKRRAGDQSPATLPYHKLLSRFVAHFFLLGGH